MTRWRWGVAALLFLATVINYIDRQTLSVVAPVLTRELGISNTEYANILTAFMVSYTFMYVISGWLCDRWGRRRCSNWRQRAILRRRTVCCWPRGWCR